MGRKGFPQKEMDAATQRLRRTYERMDSEIEKSGGPWLPEAINAAVSTTKADRSRADQTRIWRLDHRSINTPANGPISEYGT